MPLDVDLYTINDGRFVGTAVRTLVVKKGTDASTFAALTSLKGPFDFRSTETLHADDIRDFDIQKAADDIARAGFHIYAVLIDA